MQNKIKQFTNLNWPLTKTFRTFWQGWKYSLLDKPIYFYNNNNNNLLLSTGVWINTRKSKFQKLEFIYSLSQHL